MKTRNLTRRPYRKRKAYKLTAKDIKIFDFLQLESTKQKVDVQINTNKAKVMSNLIHSKNLPIKRIEIELVENYTFLENEGKIDRDNQTHDILRQINLSWRAYDRLNSILKHNYTPIILKINF